jgi:hypothetical protein
MRPPARKGSARGRVSSSKKRGAKKERSDRSGGVGRTDPASASQLEQFVGLSVILTGFGVAELWGTGMVPTYRALIPSIVGEAHFGELLTRWRDIAIRGSGDLDYLEELVTTELLQDDQLGPIARNVATLWYLGMWYQLPAAWRNVHGANARDTTFVVSSQSYSSGLVWTAMHTHPPAAKQPGYASWALPPGSRGAT